MRTTACGTWSPPRRRLHYRHGSHVTHRDTEAPVRFTTSADAPDLIAMVYTICRTLESHCRGAGAYSVYPDRSYLAVVLSYGKRI